MADKTPRSKDIARAAMLRERMIGAIRASAGGMTARQLYDWSGIAELYHGAMLPGRVQAQLRALLAQGVLDRVGGKPNTVYFIKKKREAEQAQPDAEVLKHLQLEVSRSEGTISFVFEGVRVSIKVLP